MPLPAEGQKRSPEAKKEKEDQEGSRKPEKQPAEKDEADEQSEQVWNLSQPVETLLDAPLDDPEAFAMSFYTSSTATSSKEPSNEEMSEILEMRKTVNRKEQADKDTVESEDTDKEARDDEDFEAPSTKEPEYTGILQWRSQLTPTCLFEPETGLYHKGDPSIPLGATPAPLCRTSDQMRCTRAMTRACCPVSLPLPITCVVCLEH